MAFYLIVKEGRLRELLFGVYSFLFYKPGKLVEDHKKKKYFEDYINKHLKKKYNGFEGLIYPDYLEKRFGDRYDFTGLPDEVRFRLPSILEGKGWLVLGEYGDASGRIFFFKEGNMQVIDFYNKIKGFRHIHCIHPKDDKQLYIATGDDTKFLDLWEIRENKLHFVRRIKKRFAGYTAAVKIDGVDYFGSDFSQRPNYICRLSDGKKFFFPKEAFTMFVMYFELIDNRYIMSLNMHTSNFGGRSASIFDTQTNDFVFSKVLEKVDENWQLIQGNEVK